MRDFSQNFCGKRIFFRYLQSQTGRKFPAGRISSAVEHFTRNEGVPSSNLGHVRRPFYIQGGPESSEGGRNRSAPGTGRKPQTGRNAAPAIRTGPGTDRNDSRKPKKTARTSRKASRQSETRSPEPKCGRRNETDAVSPESRRFRTEGAGGSAKVRKNRKTFRTVENRIRPAGGRYDFSERKPAETRCRKRPIRNSAE